MEIALQLAEKSTTDMKYTYIIDNIDESIPPSLCSSYDHGD